MSKDMVYESVPSLTRRQGDHLIAGQNNATILLGRDRVGPVDTGYGSRASGGAGSGAIHLSVGRKSQDPSIKDDSATIYLSAKTDPDLQADTQSVGKAVTEQSGIVMRGDCLRISARSDFKLSVGKAYMTIGSDGKIVIDGDVQLGHGAAERIIRGEQFAAIWATHTHPTPSGLSGPPQKLPDSVFSPRNKVL